MKLSNDTHALLASFSAIYQSILINPGSLLQTIGGTAVLAKAEVAETFPVQAAIYDLHQFLGCLRLLPEADLAFGAKSVLLTKGKQKIEFFYANPTLIKVPPDKTITIDDAFTFPLLNKEVGTVLKMATNFSSPNVYFVGAKGEAFIRVGDPNTPSSNSYEQSLGACPLTFSYFLPINNFLIATGIDYTVTIPRTKKLVYFKRTTGLSLEYWLAADPKSTMSP